MGLRVCLHVCKNTTCVSGTRGVQKRVSDVLEAELLMAKLLHVGAGSQTSPQYFNFKKVVYSKLFSHCPGYS